MLGKLLTPELMSLIEQRQFNQLREILSQFPPAEVAEIFSDLESDEDKAILLRILPYQLAADVFEYLELEDQEQLLHALGNEKVAQILNEMTPDDRTAILEELPATVTQRLLNLLSPEERKIAVELLGYPEDSIGRRMTPEYVAIQKDWTVTEVLAYLRRVGRDRETLNQLFVVDTDEKLVGLVRLRHLVVSELDRPVSELIEYQVPTLHAADDQETAVATFRKYDRTTMPVLDSQGKLAGVVTVDDVLDVAEEESTEDIHKLGGTEALDAPYLQTGIGSLVRKRAGWLILLFVGQMLTVTAMTYYEDFLDQMLVLALFVPLIISSGGNSGSQASTLVIRAMATRDVHLGDWWRVMRRELVSSFMLGAFLALIGLARIVFWPGREEIYGPHYMAVAMTIGFSLLGVVMFGSMVGAMLPFVLRKLRFDPAVCSAPFVATLVDVTGLVIYFTIAQAILRGLL